MNTTTSSVLDSSGDDNNESNNNNNNNNASSDDVCERLYYDDTPYLHATTSNNRLQVPGLFHNFHTAATLLRVARSELAVKKILLGDDDAGERIVTDFYDLLEKVETSINNNKVRQQYNKVMHEKFIVEVEGLDGSGKTCLVQSLVDSFQKIGGTTTATAVTAMKTPSSSLSEIRPLWDHRGGILARAFYFISNYILEYEIISSGVEEAEVIVIDRWYASTLAYTVAYHPNKQQNDDEIFACMEDLPHDIFQWPSDLHLRPNVMLLLDIDPEIRQARVENRRKVMGDGAASSRFNPWDDRLANNPELGKRIMTVMKNIQNGPFHIHVLDANGTKLQVLNDALEVVRSHHTQAKQPELQFKHDPLLWWRHDGLRLGLCDEQGRRCKHALWNLQVSFGGGAAPAAPPVLKTVGLNHVDAHGIYYWSSSSLLDNDNNNNDHFGRGVIGSVLWCAGSYPLEHQWRAEGFFTRVTKEECLLYGHVPPPSLLKHIAACEEYVSSVRSIANKSSNNNNNNNNNDVVRLGRMERDDAASYDEIVQNYLNGNKPCTSSVTISLWRFIPIRIEVLRGGPSTRISSYPQRWEWMHHHHKDDGRKNEWCMRSILPFTPSVVVLKKNAPETSSSIEDVSWKLKNCTIAVMGTHTSGKTTIGNRLSTLMRWRLDGELGTILRDEHELVENGHLYGDGTKGNAADHNAATTSQQQQQKDQWDELILKKECERDDDLLLLPSHQECCRVVETWHSGNAGWNYFRRKKELTQDEFRSTVLQQYLDAMTKHAESTNVLMIFLSVDSTNTIIDRRLNDQRALDRLPLIDETEDAKELMALNDKEFYEHMARATNIPLLVVDNTEYGEEAIEKTLKSILYFAQEHAFRRVETR